MFLAGPSWRAIAVPLVVGVVIVVVGVRGGTVFSPGDLNGENRRRSELGGVSSHAEIAGNCSACHAPPWSRETMASRCLDCHQDVRLQMLNEKPLHGTLPGTSECRDCHTEHRGARASLTSLDRFDHARAAFPLTGKHADVECASCHRDNVYKGTASSCVACHDEPSIHRGRFGLKCAECHSTLTWKDAHFAHSFPISHGRGKRGKNDCAVCHKDENDYRSYTCYGCHEHRQDKMARKHANKLGQLSLDQCAVCHPGGKKREKKKGGKGERAELTSPCPLNCIEENPKDVAPGPIRSIPTSIVEPPVPRRGVPPDRPVTTVEVLSLFEQLTRPLVRAQ